MMNNTFSSNAAGLCLCSLFFLLSVCTAEAQVKTKISPLAAASDSVVKEFDTRWPQLRLIQLNEGTTEALTKTLMEIETGKDFERLEQIGEIVAGAPLPNFAATALMLVSSPTGQTFDGFRMRVCMRYPEFDCPNDFDSDALQQAWSIASAVHHIRKNIAPTVLYLLASRLDSVPRVHALIGLDPNPFQLDLVNYASMLDTASQRILLHHLDSLVEPDNPAYENVVYQEAPPIPSDSLEKWSLESKSSNKIPRPSHIGGYSYIWLRTEGERVKEFGPIMLLRNRIESRSLWRDKGVDTMGIECIPCSNVGLAPPRIVRTTRIGWTVQLEVADVSLFGERLRSHAPIELELRLIPEKSRDISGFWGLIWITIIPDELYRRE